MIFIKHLFYTFNYFIAYRVIKKHHKNKFFRVVSWVVSVLGTLVVLAAFYLFILLFVFLIALCFASIVNLIMTIDVNRLTIITTLVIGILTGLISVIVSKINNNKDFKIEQRKIYIQTIKTLRAKLPELKEGKALDDFTIDDQLIMYASNRVIKLLGQIKRESEKLDKDIRKRAIIDKLFFTIDCMRNEIRLRGDYIVGETNYYLKVLGNGILKDTDVKLSAENDTINEVQQNDLKNKKADKK